MRRAKRALIVLGLGAAGILAIDVIGDATQTRPDHVRDDYVSEVVFDIDTRLQRDEGRLAAGLWGACQNTVTNEAPFGLERLGDDTFKVVLEPELGTHARQRLVGCLEDATIDRVLGDVMSVVNRRR